MASYQRSRGLGVRSGARAPMPAAARVPTRLRIVLACACLGAAAGIAVRALYAIVTGG